MKKLAVLTALLLFSLSASASAHPVTHLIYKDSIDGSDAMGVPSPTFSQPKLIAMDQEGQFLYVASNEDRIYKFDAQTYASAPFSALSGSEPTSVITGVGVDERGNLAVDNTGSSRQGRIYAFGRGFLNSTPTLYYPSGVKATPGEFTLFKTSNGCGIEVAPSGNIWMQQNFNNSGIREYSILDGKPTGNVVNSEYTENTCGQFAIDSQENFYQGEFESGFVRKFSSADKYQYFIGAGTSSSVAVDRSDDSVFVNDGNRITKFSADKILLDKFGQTEEYAPGEVYPGLAESLSVAVNEDTEEVFALNRGTNQIDVFAPGPPNIAADATIVNPEVTLTDAVLHGVVNPDGVPTTECFFEWGETTDYGQIAPCDEGNVFTGSTDYEVSAEIPISVGNFYHVRLAVKNEGELVTRSADRAFSPQSEPLVEKLFIDELSTESARLNGLVDPGLGEISYRFELGADTTYGMTLPSGGGVIPAQSLPKALAEMAKGLEPGTLYHYRLVATNLAGTSELKSTFTTFPQTAVLIDKCPNALSRQQTGAALLPDCRSYELASAADTGGYNVESNLVPGQQPFTGHPSIDGALLYGTHNGGIPGTGEPTNLGLDPYVAVRGEAGWTTRYVGIPADGTPSTSPFASTLLAADQSLATFAFGGPSICAPCFTDGTSGIPVRRPGKELAQGMTGPESPGPAAKPDGLISDPLSADGSHLIFGSTSQFHEAGNDSTGDISIYDRNLDTGATQVVSTDPAGNPLGCLQGAGTCHSPGNSNGIAELDISADGSRIVVAQKVSTDPDGNVYWHPYMHIGSDPHTVDLAPGTTTGVLYDGMTADGSMVFFTTRDKLASGDTDSNADIYVAEVGASGPVTPELVSVKSNGEPSNASGCDPVIEWNTVEPGPNCDAVAFGGGAGVAPANGTFYFLSPELLDGSNGEEDQANLYVVKPGGNPQFATVVDSSLSKPRPAAPLRQVGKEPLITGVVRPRMLAVNDVTGDIYVESVQREVIERYTSSGAPHPYTEGVGAGTNELLTDAGVSPVISPHPAGMMEQIAVDNHPGSLLPGAVYITTFSSDVNVFSADGEHLGDIEGLPEACGVSVEKSSGDIYVAAARTTKIWRLRLISAALPVTAANYEMTYMRTDPNGKAAGPCGTAVNSFGDIFAVNCGICEYQGIGGKSLYMSVFDSPVFSPSPGPIQAGEFMRSDVEALAVDSSTDEVFLDMGNRIDVIGPFGEPREVLASNQIKSSKGVAVNGTTHHVYVSTRNEVIELGYELDPAKPIDNPAVVHAVHQSGVRNLEDFQVSRDGRFAVFPSAAKVTDYASYGKLQIYRYDAQADSTICASCPPTNAGVRHDARLARDGNSLTADGRVFFTTRDPVVLRDTNGNLDAYEWHDGEVDLVSAGTGPFDSGLFSVSENGRDALFFTRDRLAPGDRNGSLVRIYDAREEGGYFNVPPAPPCAASDECHGPGSQPTPPAEIGSLGGTRGNVPVKKPRCKRKFVRKNGKCVKKPSRRGKSRDGKRRGGHR